MFSLILKDLLLAKKMLPFTALYGFLAIFVFSEALDSGTAVFSITVVAVGYMLMTRAAYYEDKNRSEVIIVSLPIRRHQIVYAKYLSVLAYFLIGVLSYSFAVGVVTLFNIPWYVSPLTVEVVIGGAIGLVLLSSISFPLLFKFGYIKTRMMTMFLFLGAFFLPSLIKAASKNEAAWLTKIIGSIQSQSDAVLMTYFLGLTAAILAVSIMISLKVYAKREF